MRIELFTSAFCAPCHAARSAVEEASRLVSGLSAVDLDVTRHEDEAEARGILSTPTIVLTDDAGHELFRAAGAPSVPQLLTAVARFA
ncbi:thioredoxin family protein [Frondihabitans cladoniiphilus]|uniref:Thioredoxin domain-containing protein n=1 Tax=Frondihabitans cladoniiphilus TaxID=715785 RepID=A0ABP8VRT7_9MICO